MAQYALPNANRGTTNWTESTGDADSDWFDELDEGFGAGRGSGSGPDDTTTDWQSPQNPTNEDISVELSTVTDPQSATGHIMRGRFRKGASGGQSITTLMRLRQDTTTIATDTITNAELDSAAWTTITYTLSAGEANSITDYSDLNIWVEADVTGGGPNRRIQLSALELEVPDASSPPAAYHHQARHWRKM